MDLIPEAKLSTTVSRNFPMKLKFSISGFCLLLPFLNAFGLQIYEEMVI